MSKGTSIEDRPDDELYVLYKAAKAVVQQRKRRIIEISGTINDLRLEIIEIEKEESLAGDPSVVSGPYRQARTGEKLGYKERIKNLKIEENGLRANKRTRIKVAQRIKRELRKRGFIEDPTPYVRDSVYDLHQVLDNVGNVECDYNGHEVKMGSQRYKLFKKNHKCVMCGAVGTFFALEKSRYQETIRYHFNLYGHRNNGSEVMFTKDHIIPKAHGGGDTLDNYQTMCSDCNQAKADKDVYNHQTNQWEMISPSLRKKQPLPDDPTT